MCGAIGVMAALHHKPFASLGDISHQLRSCLQIPVRMPYITVTEVGRQRDHVLCDAIAVIRAALESSDRESVAQRMDGRPWATGLAS